LSLGDQVARRDEIETDPRVARWKYEFRKSLVPPEVMLVLPTQMRRLHDYYMLASSRDDCMLVIRIKDEDYFHGEDVMWLYFEKLYQQYHQDAINIRFFSS
jgi:hypothetical protein